ncbi:MAG: hypothetical protein ACRDEA_11385 [Microcystaceae cyanobacterium]
MATVFLFSSSFSGCRGVPPAAIEGVTKQFSRGAEPAAREAAELAAKQSAREAAEPAAKQLGEV